MSARGPRPGSRDLIAATGPAPPRIREAPFPERAHREPRRPRDGVAGAARRHADPGAAAASEPRAGRGGRARGPVRGRSQGQRKWRRERHLAGHAPRRTGGRVSPAAAADRARDRARARRSGPRRPRARARIRRPRGPARIRGDDLGGRGGAGRGSCSSSSYVLVVRRHSTTIGCCSPSASRSTPARARSGRDRRRPRRTAGLGLGVRDRRQSRGGRIRPVPGSGPGHHRAGAAGRARIALLAMGPGRRSPSGSRSARRPRRRPGRYAPRPWSQSPASESSFIGHPVVAVDSRLLHRRLPRRGARGRPRRARHRESRSGTSSIGWIILGRRRSLFVLVLVRRCAQADRDDVHDHRPAADDRQGLLSRARSTRPGSIGSRTSIPASRCSSACCAWAPWTSTPRAAPSSTSRSAAWPCPQRIVRTVDRAIHERSGQGPTTRWTGRDRCAGAPELRCRASRRLRPDGAASPSPAAARSAAALSVRSHVKSWSSRPKWP